VLRPTELSPTILSRGRRLLNSWRGRRLWLATCQQLLSAGQQLLATRHLQLLLSTCH
jgi:hypothetical protein